jgi:hypothetical protein
MTAVDGIAPLEMKPWALLAYWCPIVDRLQQSDLTLLRERKDLNSASPAVLQ